MSIISLSLVGICRLECVASVNRVYFGMVWLLILSWLRPQAVVVEKLKIKIKTLGSIIFGLNSSKFPFLSNALLSLK